MNLKQLISDFPMMSGYYKENPAGFFNLLNLAYDYVVEKIKLHETLISCNINGSYQLVGQTHYATGVTEIRIKEVIDILAENYDTYCISDLESFNVIDDISFEPKAPSGTVYKYNNVVHADSTATVNIICYVYPYFAYDFTNSGNIYHLDLDRYTACEDTLTVSPSLVLPVVAKLHSLINLKKGNINTSAAFEDLCIKYINMSNSFDKEDAPKSYTTVSEVKPYAL